MLSYHLEAMPTSSMSVSTRTPTLSYFRTGTHVDYGATTTSVVYAISVQSILRTENGVITTIASSTDQLVPVTTDVELANTEYTITSVTFLPIFTSGGATAERSGTTVCATSYLRNRRRG